MTVGPKPKMSPRRPDVAAFEAVTAKHDSPEGGLAAIIARNTKTPAPVSATDGEAVNDTGVGAGGERS